MISGARYSGVPQRVQVRPFTRFAKPKSVTCTKDSISHVIRMPTASVYIISNVSAAGSNPNIDYDRLRNVSFIEIVSVYSNDLSKADYDNNEMSRADIVLKNGNRDI